MKSPFLLCGLFSILLFLPVRGAEPEVDPKDLPRIPPVEPGDVQRTFRIQKGFRIDLVAAEPLVVDPIDFCFDENGRLFVVEMRGYSERREEHLGQISVLEDTDGDGRFDQANVYAGGLPWPTAVIWFDGGIFVAATPDVYYLKDTDGDGKADLKRKIFTGFAAGVERLNVQAMMNSFRWGLDNRIHGATSLMGGRVRCLTATDRSPLELHGHDFSFDPRHPEDIRAETGGGQYGMSFDDAGNKFVCNNSSHIRLAMYEQRYADRGVYPPLPAPLADIAVDGPAAEVYRLSPDEPWRIIRTAWRVSGKVPGPVEGGGRVSGYFTAATGITIYRGDAFPPDYRGDAFVADCGSNLIHRKKLYPDGVGFIAKRPAGEEKIEFLASSDNWFRPVQLGNGPDGALYVADMYREVIEHPWSLPESIKKHLDLNSGNDRGRIYRIVPETFRQPSLPQLGYAGTDELVHCLTDRNAWRRETAARLLYERQAMEAVGGLRGLLSQSSSAVGRLQALYCLKGLRSLTVADIQRAMRDADAVVRRHAVRLSEGFLGPEAGLAQPSEERRGLEERLLTAARDSSVQVRYQTAFTLGDTESHGKAKALIEIVQQDPTNRWIRAAVLNSASRQAVEMFQLVCADAAFLDADGGKDFLRELLRKIGVEHDPEGLRQIVGFLKGLSDTRLAFELVSELAEGLKPSTEAASVLAQFAPLFKRAVEVVGDSDVSEETRVAGVHLLGWADSPSAGASVDALLESHQPQSIQLAALDTLGRFPSAQVSRDVLRHWPNFTPRVRSEALSLLLARPNRAVALLEAVAAGTVRAETLNSTQVRFLLSHRDPLVRQRATNVLQRATSSPRQEVVEQYGGALELQGHPEHGRTLYLERCSSCHRLGGQGNALGPDLVTVKNGGKEKILTSLLDPNREVAPNYLAYAVETKDGESQLGVISNESSSAVTLRQAYGKELVFRRSQIAAIKGQGTSLMPEGLEAGLTNQDVADLLEYVMEAKN